jgi:CheY-like chemotaxis protein
MNRPLNKVLYVEDELDIAEVAKLALESVGGFEVEVCHSGAAALLAIPRFKPDLLLLDVMMPGMDGPSTLTALRGVPGFSDTPVIFMTAKVMQGEVDRYQSMGAIEVIAKPFDPMILSDKIKSAWEKFHG